MNAEDLGAGVFDRDGLMLAESESTPMFMGAMPRIVQNVIELLDGDIDEGDIIFHNDPYYGATHSPDCAIVMPIYQRGALVGFAGASAHLLDIGGAYPGLNIDAVDIYAEGNIYRAVKLAVKGVRQDGLWKHILENMRTPTPNEGDIQAMIAACELAKRRYLDLIERYGLGAVEDAGQHWMTYSEQMLRREIAKIPDGEYETARGYLDDDGVNRGRKLPVKVKVIIEGDEITYDLTGSSDEVPTGYNVPFEGTTCSAMSFITRMIFLDTVTHPVYVPQNEGMTRPINVIAPKGSIFNPNFPRSCFARFCQVQRAVDLVLRALAPVVPERITAGNSAHLHFISYSGFDSEQGEYWVYLEVDEGSYGGAPGPRRTRCGGLPHREYPQQPHRGAGVALPHPHRTLRAAQRGLRRRQVAGRNRHGAGQQDAGRYHRHLRGRASRIRRALGSLRRHGGAECLGGP